MTKLVTNPLNTYAKYLCILYKNIKKESLPKYMIKIIQAQVISYTV